MKNRLLLPRLLVLAWCLSAGAAGAQSLDSGITSGFSGSVSSGFNTGLGGGFSGAVGPVTPLRPLLNPPTTGTNLDASGCAPRQASVNHSGCQPVEWIARDGYSSYDRSVEAMSPLSGLTLD